MECCDYDGTPEKVGRKRSLEINNEEQKSIFKGTCIDDGNGVLLHDGGEVLIMYRAIKNDNEKLMALATMGCPELVLVVEGLLLLQEDFDLEFLSFSGMRMYEKHVEYLLRDMEAEEKLTFSKFCFALRKALATKRDSIPATSKSQEKSARVSAQARDDNMIEAMKSGIAVYNAVGAAVMEQNEHKNGLESKEICEFSIRNLRAWADLYRKKQDRDILSHPFNFINNDLCTARRAFDVLQYIVEHGEHDTLAPLLKAAIPRISIAIKKHEKEIKEEAAQLDVGDERVEECLRGLLV